MTVIRPGHVVDNKREHDKNAESVGSGLPKASSYQLSRVSGDIIQSMR